MINLLRDNMFSLYAMRCHALMFTVNAICHLCIVKIYYAENDPPTLTLTICMKDARYNRMVRIIWLILIERKYKIRLLINLVENATGFTDF